MSMSVALVTGGAGFIGKHLVRELVSRGTKVVVVDCLLGKVHRPDFPDTAPTWPEDLRELERKGDVVLWFGDIRDKASMTGAFGSALETFGSLPEAVFHLAAEVSVSQAEACPAIFFSANVTGSAVLIETMQDVYGSGKQPFVYYASSMSVYGSFFKWNRGEYIRTNPVGMYGLSKLQPEAMFKLWANRSGGRLLIGRFFNVFGPGQSPKNGYTGVMANFIGRLLLGLEPVVFGDGEAKRSFIHVSDVVKAIMASSDEMMRSGFAPYRDTYDVCNGTVLAVKDLVKLLLDNEALIARFAEVKGADHGRPWFVSAPGRVGDVRLACSLAPGPHCTELSTEGLLTQINDFATAMAKDDDFVTKLRAGGAGTLEIAVAEAKLVPGSPT